MKGVNALHLNNATINEALQEYLAKRYVGTQLEVTSVRETNDDFVVNVKVVEEEGGDG